MADGEITRENWLEHFCDLDVKVEHIKNEAYRRGWSDALSMVRCLAQHARGDDAPKNEAEPEHLRDKGFLTRVG